MVGAEFLTSINPPDIRTIALFLHKSVYRRVRSKFCSVLGRSAVYSSATASTLEKLELFQLLRQCQITTGIKHRIIISTCEKPQNHVAPFVRHVAISETENLGAAVRGAVCQARRLHLATTSAFPFTRPNLFE